MVNKKPHFMGLFFGMILAKIITLKKI